MTRLATGTVLLLAVLALAACGGSKKTATTATSAAANGKPVSLTLWTGFTERELGVIKSVAADFQRQHPNIHVKVVGGVNDDKIVAAIRGGNAPDVAHSFSSDNTGAFCSTGAWIDLKDYMARDHVSADIFPAAPKYYTEFDGKRCALPMLADAYGLYYNKALFAKAGITHPPKTISELTADAKKLTQRNPDGSLKVVGFDPVSGFYENAAAHYGPSWGAKWVDDKGNSVLSKDPGWAKMLTWQKQLVDWYGYDKLVKFNAGAGDEFSPQQAFERGKLAMNMDGEWRVAFIKNEHPELKYGTAPFPVDDAHPELYGAGYTTGSIVGIPKTSKHQDEAWMLLKYLTTDTSALAKLTNGILNVPTTKAALKSPELRLDPKFQTFLKIFSNPHTMTTPITLVGAANQELFQSFVTKWQAGRTTDLQGGLANTDKQITEQLKNASAGHTP
jgi:multiple sugar transport system substrate-binding protein